MRFRLGTLFVAGLALLGVLALPGFLLPLEAVPSGQEPGFQRLQGGVVSLADLKAAGPLVIVTWSSWCPQCQGLSETINALAAPSRERGARLLAVNFQESRDEIERYQREHPLQAEILLDPEGRFFKTHKVFEIPSLVLVRNGEVLYKGSLTNDPAALIRKFL